MADARPLLKPIAFHPGLFLPSDGRYVTAPEAE
jgi:hypothetical protein